MGEFHEGFIVRECRNSLGSGEIGKSTFYRDFTMETLYWFDPKLIKIDEGWWCLVLTYKKELAGTKIFKEGTSRFRFHYRLKHYKSAFKLSNPLKFCRFNILHVNWICTLINYEFYLWPFIVLNIILNIISLYLY